jgi:hypothetical protein
MPLGTNKGEVMVAVIDFIVDVGVVADDEDTERLAQQVIEEEIDRARTTIARRLTSVGVEVSIR